MSNTINRGQELELFNYYVATRLMFLGVNEYFRKEKTNLDEAIGRMVDEYYEQYGFSLGKDILSFYGPILIERFIKHDILSSQVHNLRNSLISLSDILMKELVERSIHFAQKDSQ